MTVDVNIDFNTDFMSSISDVVEEDEEAGKLFWVFGYNADVEDEPAGVGSALIVLLPPTPNGSDDLIQLSEGILGSGSTSFSVRRLFNPALTLFDLWSSVIMMGGDMPSATFLPVWSNISK